MIKINLLQARKEKKKVSIKKEIIVLVLSLVLLIIILGFIQWSREKEKQNTLAENSKIKKEIASYKSLMTDVNKAKEEQKMLQIRLDTINSLRKEKTSKILDELSIIKPERLQFESLKKEGSKLGIEGIALDDETIANFMSNLRKSKLFRNVDLVVSEQFEQSKMKFKKFILSLELISI
jgi:type IV pilus assembly protein PilN